MLKHRREHPEDCTCSSCAFAEELLSPPDIHEREQELLGKLAARFFDSSDDECEPEPPGSASSSLWRGGRERSPRRCTSTSAAAPGSIPGALAPRCSASQKQCGSRGSRLPIETCPPVERARLAATSALASHATSPAPLSDASGIQRAGYLPTSQVPPLPPLRTVAGELVSGDQPSAPPSVIADIRNARTVPAMSAPSAPLARATAVKRTSDAARPDALPTAPTARRHVPAARSPPPRGHSDKYYHLWASALEDCDKLIELAARHSPRMKVAYPIIKMEEEALLENVRYFCNVMLHLRQPAQTHLAYIGSTSDPEWRWVGGWSYLDEDTEGATDTRRHMQGHSHRWQHMHVIGAWPDKVAARMEILAIQAGREILGTFLANKVDDARGLRIRRYGYSFIYVCHA